MLSCPAQSISLTLLTRLLPFPGIYEGLHHSCSQKLSSDSELLFQYVDMYDTSSASPKWLRMAVMLRYARVWSQLLSYEWPSQWSGLAPVR